ncbi:MAG: dATP/dGTP diphosphohydrolase domain-containing protein [Clostridia bacterium]
MSKSDDYISKEVGKMFGILDSKKTQNTTSLKYDAGKLRLDLIPPITYEALGRVLTFGAEKYSANSWQGIERERYVGALLRHFVEYMKDPDSVDAESGFKHIEHVLCNAMFLNYMANS